MSLENFTGQLMAEWQRDLDSNSVPAKLTLTLCGKPRACKQRRLFPERRQFKIRGTDRHVIWYKTADHAALKAPPTHLLRPQQHALYVHTHPRGVQAWMYCPRIGREGAGGRDIASEWRRTCEGQEHPDLGGYVLHFLESGAPRWVRNLSAKAYEKAQRKRKAMVAGG
ncbi:hypothetical protein C8T65DRAFT_743139 [Cerioporus squamosus]|nr:hypothetical protein C8T65DRAFT_743139 [Cerioporus squamosus]